MRSRVIRWSELVLIGSVMLSGTFWMTTQLASAQALPLGAQIVCLVYHGLSPFTPPEPFSLQHVSLCQSTPTSATGNLEVIKLVNGGTSTSADFDIHVATGGNEIAGSPVAGSATGVTFVGLPTGPYKVSETGSTLSQYSGVFSGDCDTSGSISVTASATAVCTLTNTFISTSTGPGNSSVGGGLVGTVTGTSSNSGGLTGTVGSSTGSLTGTVASSSTLSGNVGSGNTLTGTVVSGSSGGGGGGGGGSGSQGVAAGNGPIVGGGGGVGPIAVVGGNPPGQVLGASTATNPSSQSLPGVPNTGAGGEEAQNVLLLLISGAVAIGSLTLLARRQLR